MHISSSFLVDPAVLRATALAPSIGMAPTLLSGGVPVEEPPPLPKDETKTSESRPLRVAHLGPCLFRGGAEQQLIDLAKFLDPKVAVLERCIVTGANSVDPAVARDFACEVVPATRELVAETLRTFDVLLYWGMELKGWIEPTDERRAVVVYLAHGDSHWTRDLLRNSAHLTDHAIAVSRRVLETTCQNFPSTVVLNGVDTARLATTRSRYEVRAEFGYCDDDFVVGYVGRFSPEKRPETLLRALELLPRSFKGLFIGWGPMQAQLLEEANRTVPNRCAFRFVDRYLGDYYQAFDAFSLSSIQEGFALVFLEAMFAGKPVVATSVGAVPEVIHDRINGIIVDGSPIELAKALARLEGDPRWARGVAECASEYAKSFGYARRMAKEYEAVFRRLVETRRNAA